VYEHRGQACLSEDPDEWNGCAVEHGFEYCGVRVCTTEDGGDGRQATVSSLRGSQCAFSQPQCAAGSAAKSSSSFVRVDVVTDAFAAETAWEVRRSARDAPVGRAAATGLDLLLAGGGPVYLGNNVLLGRAGVGPPLGDNDASAAIACLEDAGAAGSCFDLRAHDAYGDGMGCGGDGRLAFTLVTPGDGDRGDDNSATNRVFLEQRDRDMAAVAEVDGAERLACLNERRLKKWSYCAVRVCANGDVMALEGNECDFGLGENLLDELPDRSDAGDEVVEVEITPQKTAQEKEGATITLNNAEAAEEGDSEVVVIKPQEWGAEDQEAADAVIVKPPISDSGDEDKVTIKPQKAGAAEGKNEDPVKIKPQNAEAPDSDSNSGDKDDLNWNFNLDFQWDIINGDNGGEEATKIKLNKADVEAELEPHPDWDLNVNDLKLNIIHDEEEGAVQVSLNSAEGEEGDDEEEAVQVPLNDANDEEGDSLRSSNDKDDLNLNLNLNLQWDVINQSDKDEAITLQLNTADFDEKLYHNTWAEYYEAIQPQLKGDPGDERDKQKNGSRHMSDGFVHMAPYQDGPDGWQPRVQNGPRPNSPKSKDGRSSKELYSFSREKELKLKPFSANLLNVNYPTRLKNSRRRQTISDNIADYLLSYFGRHGTHLRVPAKFDLDCTTSAEKVGLERRWVVYCTGVAQFRPSAQPLPGRRDMHAVILDATRGQAQEAFFEVMYGKESRQQGQLKQRHKNLEARKRKKDDTKKDPKEERERKKKKKKERDRKKKKKERDQKKKEKAKKEREEAKKRQEDAKRDQKKKEKQDRREALKQAKLDEEVKMRPQSKGTMNIADFLGDESGSSGDAKRDKEPLRGELNVMGYVTGSPYMDPMSASDQGYKFVDEGLVHVYINDDERRGRRHLRRKGRDRGVQ